MCALCEAAGQAVEFSVTSRPAHRLAGLWWSGTFDAAATGEIQRRLARVRDFYATRDSVWKSPLVGLSRNERADGFDYYVGVDVGDDADLPPDFSVVEVPELTLVSAWHGPDDGAIPQRYGAMMIWLREHGYTPTTTVCDHREEYPHDTDDAATRGLRLMIPVFREFP